jgi:hypothetical protein
LEDLCGRAVTGLEPKPGVKRILIGHGAVSELSMGRDDPSIIDLERLEAKIASGALSYVALGDRHSTLSFGKSGRVWCSGSLQATSFAEVDAGNILVVDLGEQVNVTKVPISDWRFVEESFVFNDDGDIKLLEEKLTRSEKKDTTVLSLDLSGTLSINGLGVLDNLISWSRDLFAAVDEGERKIVVNLDDEAMRSQLSGFTLATFERLSAMAKGDGPDAATAKDALSLLRRLSGGCGQ